MIAEIFPSLLGVVCQGGIKNSLEVGGSESCIKSRGHEIMEMSDDLSANGREVEKKR